MHLAREGPTSEKELLPCADQKLDVKASPMGANGVSQVQSLAYGLSHAAAAEPVAGPELPRRILGYFILSHLAERMSAGIESGLWLPGNQRFGRCLLCSRLCAENWPPWRTARQHIPECQNKT